MIKLENVTKYYKFKNIKHTVIDNVSFTFPDKTNIGILGRNGAGKSTLLRLLGGMELPNKGKITCDGKVSWPVGKQQGTPGSLSARDCVKFVCQLYGKSIDETKGIIAYVQDFAEIGKHFDMPLKTYSSGMKSRVNFGISMAFDFEYYLIDECTSTGDRIFRNKACQVFAEKRKRASVIMVTHNMNEIEENCDIALFIHNGHIEYYADVKEGIERYSSIKKQILIK